MRFATLLAALLASGCAGMSAGGGPMQFSGVTVYQDSEGALDYHAPAGADVGKALPVAQVQGKACQYGITIPFGPLVAIGGTGGDIAGALGGASAGWGEGGYREAIAQAEAKAGGGRLFDVRADMNVVSILGIWREECVVVTASVAPGK